MGRVNSHSTGKGWENKYMPMGFLHFSREAQIHKIPKTWEKGNFIVS